MKGYWWVTLLFTPWVLYWTLCGFGFRWSVAAGLASSVAVYLVGLRRGPRMLSLFRLAAPAYFTAAVIDTYLLGGSTFVENCGFAGYAALSAATLASLFVGSPFTYEVALLDYPGYRDVPEFRAVNRVLTAVWSALFAAASLVSLLPRPLGMASHLLMVVGIVLSSRMPEALVVRGVSGKVPRYSRWRPRGSGEVVVVCLLYTSPSPRDRG